MLHRHTEKKQVMNAEDQPELNVALTEAMKSKAEKEDKTAQEKIDADLKAKKKPEKIDDSGLSASMEKLATMMQESNARQLEILEALKATHKKADPEKSPEQVVAEEKLKDEK